MKITVRPSADPSQELDLTHRLTAAIAQELWCLFGGNEKLNWVEAERHLERIVGMARREATRVELLASPARVNQEPAACPGCPRRRAGLKRSQLAVVAG